MNKTWNLIQKILSGEKTIESRWYQTRRTPWDKIRDGDRVFFKNSGESITAEAKVSEVLQFQIENISDAREIVEKYGKEISLVNPDPGKWSRLPRYCVLIRLESPKTVEPVFQIDKSGFGTGVAWITVDNIERIRT